MSEPTFVRIADRIINLNAILWVEIDPAGMTLVFSTDQGGDRKQYRLEGQDMQKMMQFLERFSPDRRI